MDPKQYEEFVHDALHELMDLNERCGREFNLSLWPRWDYDCERGTLTFSKDGVPKVVASIQVVGTTSIKTGTWLWSWANQSFPANVRTGAAEVRAFGEAERIKQLSTAKVADDEHLGWALTAVAAKILRAKGAYRCPDENGFVYVVYSSIGFAEYMRELAPSSTSVECSEHGAGYATYVCEHLAANPAQLWFSGEATEEDKWPDAWCAACNIHFEAEGEWNEKNESKMKLKLLCHRCYEKVRAKAKSALAS